MVIICCIFRNPAWQEVEKGLTTSEASQRYDTYGPNGLVRELGLCEWKELLLFFEEFGQTSEKD